MSIPFDSTPNFSETVTCTIPKQADLIHKIILSIQLPEVILVRSLNQTLVQNATAELLLPKLILLILILMVVWYLEHII